MRRRGRRRGRAQAAAPIIVVSDDDSEDAEPSDPGPHPWRSRTVAAVATAAAAIARAGRRAAEDVAVAVQQPAVQPAHAAAPVAPAETAVPAAAQQAHAAASAEEAGASCSICYEPLYEEGSHRPAALKCGHIFGNECIKRWLQQQNKCPQCNQRAKTKEITLLYNLPKLAAGSAPEDIQQQIKQLEASKRQEQQRAAELERSLKELQRQLAVKEHQQLQQQQQQQQVPPLPSGVAAGCGLSSWQQQQQQQQQGLGSRIMQQQQQVPTSGPGRPSYHMQYQQQQQQQQLRPPLQPVAQAYGHLGARAAVPGAPHQQQHMVGQKRPWEQAVSLGQQQPQQQQQQQQPPAMHTLVTWPLLTLLPIPALTANSATAAATAGSSDAHVEPAGRPTRSGAIRWQAGSEPLMSAAGGLPLRRRLPGCFSTLQEFDLSGSRSFYLDVPGTMAVVGETPGTGCSRLRKISLVCPTQLSYLQLPHNAGAIRCLASHKQLLTAGSGMDVSNINPNYLAAATDKAGLLIISLNSNNIVQTIPVSGPVWSVAWSPQNSQQLLLGLDKGRIAIADIRKSSSQAVLLTSSASSCCKPMQPLHSLLALQPCQLGQLSSSSRQQPGWDAGAPPEAVVACAGGVYSWCRSQPDTFNMLLPSSCHGGNCESIALAADGQTLAVSFRSPFGWSPALAAIQGGGFVPESSTLTKGAPVHVLSKLGVIQGPEGLSALVGSPGGVGDQAEVEMLPTQSALGAEVIPSDIAVTQPAAQAGTAFGWMADPAALDAAITAGQQQLMQQTVKLFGHHSSKSLTHGCFLPGLPGLPDEQQLFLSANELTCQPGLWGCSSGALLEQRQPWPSLPSHILQLDWGRSDSLSALLVGAMSDRKLVLCDWQPDNNSVC